MTITVRNVRQVNAALRKVNADLPKETAKELNGVANLIAGIIRAKVPRLTGAAKGSIGTRSSQSSAKILAGGRRVPYYQWLDFGGRVGRNKSIRRPFIKEGRYIYPTIREQGPNIQKEVENALVRVARKAGFEVR